MKYTAKVFQPCTVRELITNKHGMPILTEDGKKTYKKVPSLIELDLSDKITQASSNEDIALKLAIACVEFNRKFLPKGVGVKGFKASFPYFFTFTGRNLDIDSTQLTFGSNINASAFVKKSNKPTRKERIADEKRQAIEGFYLAFCTIIDKLEMAMDMSIKAGEAKKFEATLN